MMKLVLGAVAAMFLVAAAPAVACDDCKNCPMHKKDSAAAETKAPAVADADKKDGCACKHGDATKECKCGETCKCKDCPIHGKKNDKKDEPKKS
jgi:hypothetical protein